MDDLPFGQLIWLKQRSAQFRIDDHHRFTLVQITPGKAVAGEKMQALYTKIRVADAGNRHHGLLASTYRFYRIADQRRDAIDKRLLRQQFDIRHRKRPRKIGAEIIPAQPRPDLQRAGAQLADFIQNTLPGPFPDRHG
ncbi:hypothetical protein D3C80_1327770 [compost metagenome]